MVWDAIMAGNQAMLEYLQREAGYSRAGYHSKNSGRFVDAHQWVIASFAQHTSRDNDPQLHVHNAILNRVLREDPLASRRGDRRAWRTLDGAALYAAKPAAGAIAERTLTEYLSERLGVQTVARADGNGWEDRRCFRSSARAVLLAASRHRAARPGTDRRIRAQARQGAERARRLVDGAIRDARFAPGQRRILRRPGRRCWRNGRRSRAAPRPRRSAPSRMPRSVGAIPAPIARPPSGADVDRILAAAVADAQRS